MTVEKYRPSSGMEGESFISTYCMKCKHRSKCQIIGNTMFYDVEDDNYPEQWRYGEDGLPTCTDFEEQ